MTEQISLDSWKPSSRIFKLEIAYTSGVSSYDQLCVCVSGAQMGTLGRDPVDAVDQVPYLQIFGHAVCKYALVFLISIHAHVTNNWHVILN